MEVYQIIKRTGKRSSEIVGTYLNQNFATTYAANIIGFEESTATVQVVEVLDFTSMEQLNEYESRQQELRQREIIAEALGAMDESTASAFRSFLTPTALPVNTEAEEVPAAAGTDEEDMQTTATEATENTSEAPVASW